MKFYNKKLVFDYVVGNDLDDYEIDELENTPEFMIEVIKYTQDKKMYNFCSDNVKSNLLNLWLKCLRKILNL